MRTEWRTRLVEVLDPLPTPEGGITVVMATAGRPPAMAMLSSGDVHVSGDRVRVGVFGSSSTASRLDGAFSLLVPAGTVALRVEVVDAEATRHGDMALIEGQLHDVRPTSEPPWVGEMRFRPANVRAAAIPEHLSYWGDVRAWLAGERDEPPMPPA